MNTFLLPFGLTIIVDVPANPVGHVHVYVSITSSSAAYAAIISSEVDMHEGQEALQAAPLSIWHRTNSMNACIYTVHMHVHSRCHLTCSKMAYS